MFKRLKIIHLAAGNLYGGVETFLRTLALCRDMNPGLLSEFAVCFEGRLSAELREAGATVHHVGGVRFSRPWTVWRARRRLARVISGRGIDVVVGHCCWAHLLLGPAGRRAGRPVVYWMHEMIHGTHWVERRAARVKPDLVLSCSRVAAGTLARIFPDARPEVVRTPVIGRRVDWGEGRLGVRGELGTPGEDVVIVTACRLEPWKGHGLLIASLARLRDRAGWTAWVAGGAQRPEERRYLEAIQAQAREAGIGDRVRFLGQRGDVPRLLGAADIHCQPNLSPEPFGIAFVEALYAGLPVVSTRMGGASEIVTDACGVLVPPSDPDALASALLALMDAPGERARLGAAGPARAAELCAPEVVLPRLESLLAGLVSGGHGARGHEPSAAAPAARR